ncbi:MAG TPA: mechanosensitive ion channel domain-containing protein [Buchnera sp. (in: enterobacteria)]|nr:mechanosensitive ion channel domain-containing protein [Buchnera sp. (in: enterobacteria)]
MKEISIINKIFDFGHLIILKQELMLCYLINFSSTIFETIVGIIIAKIITKVINSLLIIKNINPDIATSFTVIAKYIIIIFTIVSSLAKIGIDITSTITIVGAIGIAIGLAVQGSLSNFASGILLITLQPFKIGEYVDLGNIAGTIINIHVFYTTLRTLDGKIVIIPNGKIISKNIINYSRERFRRNEFIINVGYDSDIDMVIKILKKTIESEERVIQDLGIVIGLSELTPSSLKFIVRCWSDTDDLNIVYWDLMAKFKKQLDKNLISIPYPKIQIELK